MGTFLFLLLLGLLIRWLWRSDVLGNGGLSGSGSSPSGSSSSSSGFSDVGVPALANDLYGPALNAMTDNLNSAKQARDPAQWLPPYAASRCPYAIWWVQVKYRWRLKVDSAERTKLASILSGTCGSRVVTIPTRAL